MLEFRSDPRQLRYQPVCLLFSGGLFHPNSVLRLTVDRGPFEPPLRCPVYNGESLRTVFDRMSEFRLPDDAKEVFNCGDHGVHIPKHL